MVSQELIEHLQTHSLDDLKRRLESENKSVQRYFRLWQESRAAAETIREAIRQKQHAQEQAKPTHHSRTQPLEHIISKHEPKPETCECCGISIYCSCGAALWSASHLAEVIDKELPQKAPHQGRHSGEGR